MITNEPNLFFGKNELPTCPYKRSIRPWGRRGQFWAIFLNFAKKVPFESARVSKNFILYNRINLIMVLSLLKVHYVLSSKMRFS
jgi:hypothetical protein